MGNPIIELKDVTKDYSLAFSVNGKEVLAAVEKVNLRIQKGEFVAIIGPSGCGKSTLLNMIGGLVEPSHGEIYVEGELISGPHPKITMVFQDVSVFPWRSVMENVEFGLEVRGLDRQSRRRKCQGIIDLVGLRGFEERYPQELSGGMNQRVAIARALALDPDILLMDEPFGALDEQTRLILGEELLRIWGELGQTIVFITHNINESVQLADRVIIMSARPGLLKKEVLIDLARPRDPALVSSQKFATLVGEIWAELREESLKALRYEMGSGEKATPKDPGSLIKL
ncbi:MAG TPA: ABC transporter ATP-binding protein [bacterium]|nr:ABC transporter ATP-binding protein [bacterium]